MVEDLATLAPSVIVCVAFGWGIWALIRHEMAPKRTAREDDDQDTAPAAGGPSGAPASPAPASREDAAATASQRGEL